MREKNATGLRDRWSDEGLALGHTGLSVDGRIRLTRGVESAMIDYPCEYQNAKGEVPDDEVTCKKGKKRQGWRAVPASRRL